MQQLVRRLTDKHSVHFADQVGGVFKSIPNLPKGLVEFFVKVAPYLALLGAIFSLLAGPLLGFLSIISFISLNPLFVLSVGLAAVFSVAMAILLFLAFKPLKQRKHEGWMLLFWSEVLYAAETVVMILLGQSSFLGIIGILIGFYIYFQMRPFYKGAVAEVPKPAKK